MAVHVVGPNAPLYTTLQGWWDAETFGTEPQTAEIAADYPVEPNGGTYVLLATGKNGTAANPITITSSGMSALDFLEANPGQPLKHDRSYGPALDSEADYVQVIRTSAAYLSVENLQLKSTTNTVISIDSDQTGGRHRRLIIAGGVGNVGAISLSGSDCWLFNSLCVNISGATNAYAVTLSGSSKLLNCSLVRPTDLVASQFSTKADYGSPEVLNTAFFAGTDLSTGGSTTTPTTSFTNANVSLPGMTGNLAIADQFEGVTVATENWRLKSTSDMRDTGTNDARVPIDIFGRTRPQGSVTDGGAEEYEAGGPPPVTDEPSPGAAQQALGV